MPWCARKLTDRYAIKQQRRHDDLAFSDIRSTRGQSRRRDNNDEHMLAEFQVFRVSMAHRLVDSAESSNFNHYWFRLLLRIHILSIKVAVLEYMQPIMSQSQLSCVVTPAL